MKPQPNQNKTDVSKRSNDKFNTYKKKQLSSGKPKPKKSVVEIFTAPFCPHCREAKAYLHEKKIPFREFNLERSREAEKRFLGMGAKSVPLIIVNGIVIKQWNRAAFDKAYDS